MAEDSEDFEERVIAYMRSLAEEHESLDLRQEVELVDHGELGLGIEGLATALDDAGIALSRSRFIELETIAADAEVHTDDLRRVANRVRRPGA